jgi:hypothetical protein
MCSPPCRFRPPAMALTITMPHQVHNLMGIGAVRSERSVIFRRQCLPVLGRLHLWAQYRSQPGRAHRAVGAHDKAHRQTNPNKRRLAKSEPARSKRIGRR